MDTQRPEALRLAGVLRALDARSRFANAQLTSASEELEILHAENEALRASYDAALDEIASLQARVQELGQMARDVNSRRVVELEAQLAAVGAGGVEPLRKRECLHKISEPVQPLVCDYCGALTPDPWHSSGMLHGKMSKHIHSCDACAARKPLADGVLHALYADEMAGHFVDALHYWSGTPAHRFARSIEKSHGITAAQKGGKHGTE